LRPVISGVTSRRVAITADVTDRERVDAAIGKAVAPWVVAAGSLNARVPHPGRPPPRRRTRVTGLESDPDLSPR
jgi:hypothetical protein